MQHQVDKTVINEDKKGIKNIIIPNMPAGI